MIVRTVGAIPGEIIAMIVPTIVMKRPTTPPVAMVTTIPLQNQPHMMVSFSSQASFE